MEREWGHHEFRASLDSLLLEGDGGEGLAGTEREHGREEEDPGRGWRQGKEGM